ncbi:MAG: BcepIL02 [Alphaproteobacteria bacterium]|jgi:hypothetical protein|nr:BcepIL02 [Alphaproteobacteria bacterium]
MSFDLQDESLTKTRKDSPLDRLPASERAAVEKPAHPMDEPAIRDRHAMLVAKYRYELEVQSANRAEMAKDEDYYDHLQWTEEDAQVLKDRGQAPIVYNVIAQTVNWVIGSEKRGRTDFKILPRGAEDAKPAEAKTKYLKYISDVWRTPFNRSRAFEDAVKVGLGWIETSVPDDEEDEPTGDRYESWRNMLWDSAATEMDTSDMRYQFRSKWVDLDIAIAMFPHCKSLLENSANEIATFGSASMEDGDEAMDGAEASREIFGGTNPIYIHKRRRVRLIEAWYREPEEVEKIKGGSFKGDIFDKRDPRHVEAVQSGNGQLHKKVVMRARVMFMTTTHPLYDGPSPFKHNRLKFIPVWGYRRGRDGLPYGIIRGLRDIQDDINKRASKALHILSSNKIAMETGALADGWTPDDLAEEAAKPDALMVFANGALSGNKVRMDVDRELAPAHLDLMSRNIMMIQQVGGVTDEQMGKSTNATSGKAILARQEQGSLATNKLFDNLRFAVQLHGEITLCNIEQFVTDQKQFRITNQRGTPEFITMNDGLPENDISRSKADFVVSESDWRATMRQAAVDQLTEMVSKMPPQVGMLMLDLIVEQMDLPNGEEISKRVRQMNGMRDPEATELTAEEQQAMQAQAAQQQMQARAAEAEIAEKEAKADNLRAATDKIKADTVNANMAGAKAAMEAATLVITQPTIAKVGDNLLMQGGWTGGKPVPAGLAAQGLPPQAAQQPPAPAPEPMPPMEQQPQPGA